VLGDNIFYGDRLPEVLQEAARTKSGAVNFGYRVHDPERYGVVTFDGDGNPVEITEKPESPASNIAVTGIYFYDNDVVSIAKSLTPSARGELEITDVNAAYLARGDLKIHVLSRGTAWLDTGTHESLLGASQFIQVLAERQGLKVACPEEIAWRMGYLDDEGLERLAAPLVKSGYGEYLLDLVKRGKD